ncbi:MAG: tetratricopeptide repeat protein [Candidatus Aegiribacteria sp.]|nr:tetratricopeptide repeat protein [Candidatus Aegiribacteria sp.]
MSVSSEGFLGRQLLSIRNTISSVTDPSRLRKLRRREIRILLQLGNTTAAGDICRELVSDNPSWPPGYSIMADLACWSGEWEEGERLFERAATEHETAGNIKAASRLRTGPVYRLAEARDNYEKCLSLCSGEGELESILKIRSGRLLGSNEASLPEEAQDWLGQRLLMLESAWRGTHQHDLLQIAVDWSNTEPEWRWRFIVEGMAVWKRDGLDLDGWKKPVRSTVCPILDPRFHREWRSIFQ